MIIADSVFQFLSLFMRDYDIICLLILKVFWCSTLHLYLLFMYLLYLLRDLFQTLNICAKYRYHHPYHSLKINIYLYLEFPLIIVIFYYFLLYFMSFYFQCVLKVPLSTCIQLLTHFWLIAFFAVTVFNLNFIIYLQHYLYLL